MNKIIKKQLANIREVRLPKYDDDTTEIIIPRKIDIRDIVKVGEFVIVEFAVAMYLQDSSFTTNWNHGVKPPRYMVGRIDNSMSNMYLISGCRYDIEKASGTDEYYQIWFPLQYVVSANKINMS